MLLIISIAYFLSLGELFSPLSALTGPHFHKIYKYIEEYINLILSSEMCIT